MVVLLTYTLGPKTFPIIWNNSVSEPHFAAEDYKFVHLSMKCISENCYKKSFSTVGHLTAFTTAKLDKFSEYDIWFIFSPNKKFLLRLFQYISKYSGLYRFHFSSSCKQIRSV